jgi:hypothetical protein
LNFWNWKAGLMSAVYRAPVFFRQPQGGLAGCTIGDDRRDHFSRHRLRFYGAFTQAIRRMEPAWLLAAIVLVLAPVVVQVLEFAVHRFSRTANLRTGILISSTMTAVASLFNWYAMRQGAMLTGQDPRPFGEDLRRLRA